MREGNNTIRGQIVNKNGIQHRIIIPFYVNRQMEHYRDSLDILEVTLKSLKYHSVYDNKITVILNGAVDNEIQLQLNEWYNLDVIQELIFIKDQVGKLNAILKSLRSTREPFVTITDADVLFLPEWDIAIFKVFKSFKKAAAVSPTPIFRTHNRLTSNIWFDYLFSKRLKFIKVVNPQAMTLFAKSIGWPRLDVKWKDVYLTLSGKNGNTAVLGNSHYCVTYKTSVFKNIPYQESEFILGGDSEYIYLDLPPVKCNGYRLSTSDNYAYHIGNILEDWIKEFEMKKVIKKDLTSIPNHLMTDKPILYFIKFKLFKKLFFSKRILSLFYKFKGLNKEQLKSFLS